MKRVEKRGPSQCWPWTGRLESGRPARIRVPGNKDERVHPHRAIWEIEHGIIPDGLALVKTCRNVLCMNTRHMKPGQCTDLLKGAEADWYSTGNLNEIGLKRFWSKVKRRGKDECWEWNAGLARDGYGKFNLMHTTAPAHRVAWIIKNGPLDPSVYATHKCDNRKCCNPDHIVAGSAQSNMDDKMERERWTGGHPGGTHRRLTQQQVIAIRTRFAAGDTQRGMAKEFGVAAMTIHAIVTRKTWKHLS